MVADRREPQRQRRGELDVTAAHHAGIEGAGEQHENSRAGGELDAIPGQGDSATDSPIDRRKQRDR